MTINIEYETEKKLDLDYETIIRQVVEKAMDYEKCPYEAEVNVTLTDNAAIHEINREYREIDRVTDVLSFPFNDFTYGRGTLPPCAAEEATALLLLGDIVVSIPAVKRQAKEYGHSEERECAFLICHGMLHLLGYDHTTEEEEQQMFGFADEILTALRYTRDAGSV